MVRLTATEVAREFSKVVNRVATGEEFEVVRNGVAVAQLSPVPGQAIVSAARWREVIDSAPGVDAEFKQDVESAREAIEPPDSAWPS